MSRRRLRPLAVLAVTALTLGLGPAAAHAGAATSWWTACAGYSGKSWYSTQTNLGYSTTVASDNDMVGAALRYYGGSTKYDIRPGHAEMKRAVVPSGGYHQSYCGWAVTKHSNA